MVDTAAETQVVEPFPSAVGPAASFDIETAEPSGVAVPHEAEPWAAAPFLHLASSWLGMKQSGDERKRRTAAPRNPNPSRK